MCVFCDIATSGANAWVVASDDSHVAFLDRRPLQFGHILVIPRAHVETLPELPADLVGPLFTFVQRLAEGVKEAMAAEGTFIAVNNTVSQSVAHLHVHVVPRRKGDGLKGFFWPRHAYDSDAHAEKVRDSIRRALER